MKISYLLLPILMLSCSRAEPCSAPPPPTTVLVGTLTKASNVCEDLIGRQFLFQLSDFGCKVSSSTISSDQCSVHQDLSCPYNIKITLSATASESNWHHFTQTLTLGQCSETADLVETY